MENLMNLILVSNALTDAQVNMLELQALLIANLFLTLVVLYGHYKIWKSRYDKDNDCES